MHQTYINAFTFEPQLCINKTVQKNILTLAEAAKQYMEKIRKVTLEKGSEASKAFMTELRYKNLIKKE